MRRGLCVFLVLALAGLTRGADPQIVGPDKKTVPAYKVVKFEITGLGETDGVLWRVRPVDPKAAVDFGREGKRNETKLEFVAPPGGYTVEVTIVCPPPMSGKRFVIDELTDFVTITDPLNPVPVPPVPVPPVPVPPVPVPPVPVPPAPDIDAALVVKYKAAIEADVKAAFPAGGSKENAVKLAEVYLFAADKLTALDGAAPDTVGKMFEVVATLSAKDKKIPRLPYLSAVRSVTGEAFGALNSTEALDSTKRGDFAVKFRKLGLALKEAAK